jgi:hypothetical protein
MWNFGRADMVSFSLLPCYELQAAKYAVVAVAIRCDSSVLYIFSHFLSRCPLAMQQLLKVRSYFYWSERSQHSSAKKSPKTKTLSGDAR